MLRQHWSSLQLHPVWSTGFGEQAPGSLTPAPLIGVQERMLSANKSAAAIRASS